MEHLSYDNKLTKLGLMHLSSKRIISDLVETVKTASDSIDTVMCTVCPSVSDAAGSV